MKYRIYGIATISKFLGEVEADSKEQAEDKAYEELADELHIRICHQCSHEMQDTPQIDSLEVEEVKE